MKEKKQHTMKKAHKKPQKEQAKKLQETKNEIKMQ